MSPEGAAMNAVIKKERTVGLDIVDMKLLSSNGDLSELERLHMGTWSTDRSIQVKQEEIDALELPIKRETVGLVVAIEEDDFYVKSELADLNSTDVTTWSCFDGAEEESLIMNEGTARRKSLEFRHETPEWFSGGVKLELPVAEELCIKEENPTFLDYSALQKQVSDRRLKRFQRVKSLKCDICGYVAQDTMKLKSHLRTHTGEKPFGCSDCDFRTAWKHSLRQHVLVHTGEKPFKCELCEYRTAVKDRLHFHMLVHSEVKSFKCAFCKYETVRKAHLDRHMTIHTGEKPFGCNECEFRTARKTHLQRHVMIHTGEKPFACPECGFRASQKYRLQQHMKTHVGKKPFECNRCQYTTAWKRNLEIHVKVHLKEKPFECHTCGFRATWKSILKKHIVAKKCSNGRSDLVKNDAPRKLHLL